MDHGIVAPSDHSIEAQGTRLTVSFEGHISLQMKFVAVSHCMLFDGAGWSRR